MFVELAVRRLVFGQYRPDNHPTAGFRQHNPLFQLLRIGLDYRLTRLAVQVDGNVNRHRTLLVEQQRRNFQTTDLGNVDHDLGQFHQRLGHRPDILFRLQAVFLQQLVHVSTAQQLTGQHHVQGRQGNLPVGHDVYLGTGGATHHQWPEHIIPGNAHAEFNSTHVLVGVLNGKAQEAAVREMLLVFLLQETTGIDDGLLAVQLLHGALVAALCGAEIQERMTHLLVDHGYVDRAALDGEHLQHFFHIVTVHGVDGVHAVITDNPPGFPA